MLLSFYDEEDESPQLVFLTWTDYLTLNAEYTYSTPIITDGYIISFNLQLDADPQNEILSSGFASNGWYIWNTGPEGLQDQVNLDDGIGVIHEENIVDIDNDGDLDICSMCTSTGKLGWYENLGNGFSDFILIHHSVPQNLYTNRLVPVLNENSDQLTLFVFRYDESSFKVEIIDGEFQEPENIDLVQEYLESLDYSDYNNDGYTDWAYSVYGEMFVAKGADSEPFGIVEIQSNEFLYGEVKWVDMNNDNLTDLVATSGFSDEPRVHVWLNNGSGINTWEEEMFSIEQDLLGWDLKLTVIDRMNDGYPDFLFAGYPQLSWWINYTADGFTGMEMEPIEIISDSYGDFDFDGDGLIDLIGVIDYQNYVYRNNGNGGFSIYCTLPNFNIGSYYQELNSIIADVDNNGSLEFILSTQDEVFLYDLMMTYLPNPISCDVFYDDNLNGAFDASEEYLSLIPLEVISNNETSVFQGAGVVWLTGETGDFSITPDFDSSIWELTTDSASYTFSILEEGEVPNYPLVFGLYPVGDNPSVALSSVTSGYSCANELFYYQAGVYNDGNAIMNGVLSVTIDSDITSFLDFLTIPDSIVGSTAYWTISDVLPGEFANRTIVMSHPGIDFIDQSFLVQIEYTRLVEENEVPLVEVISSEHLILCAYDPNDKAVSPEGYTDWGYIQSGTVLEYTVRFQNTGNASAETVTILDPLDENLIFDTFELIGASHNLNVQRDDQGLITFHFPEIFLPDSGSDYLGSMGYVKYRIQSAESIAPGTELKNTAYIYFDNNPPIVTNTVRNTIYTCDWLYGDIGLTEEDGVLNAVDLAVEVQWYMNGSPIFGETEYTYTPIEIGEYSVLMTMADGCQVMSETYSIVSTDSPRPMSFSVFPNPAHDILNVQLNGNVEGKLRIVDLLGRVVVEENNPTTHLTIDVSVLSTGAYVIEWIDENGYIQSTKSLIKQ